MLDRLLEDDPIEIEGISGTSAGAMNAHKNRVSLFLIFRSFESIVLACAFLTYGGVSLFVVAVVVPILELVAVIILGTLFGSF